MDFAKKLLNKYGWKEGEGLGKNNNGIAKPLKASLKFDSAGFGADQAASDFNNHWWERVFNDAAQNVEVKTNGKHIQLDLRNPDNEVEISTKGYSVKKLKKVNAEKDTSGMLYNNFMQSATLTSAGTVVNNPFKITEEEIQMAPIKTLTDDELFAACGGRTAHKGARHGLKLSGKLARLQKQEDEMLAKMLEEKKTKKPESVKNDNKPLQEVKNIEEISEDLIVEEIKTKTKKKKKKHSEKCENVIIEENEHLEEPHRKRMKKEDEIEINDQNEELNLKEKKNKKQKKKDKLSKNAMLEENEHLEEPDKNTDDVRIKKKKSKRK